MIFEKYVCDIIQHEMGLSADQIWLWDQKINEPTDERLYIAVSVLSSKPFGNSTVYESVEDGGLNQIQSVNVSSVLSLDVMSRGTAARDRKEQVILALKSTYAESLMEIKSFNVSMLPSSFINLTKIEGSGILYRFNASVRLQYFVSKISPVSYFDTFQAPTILVDQ
jgi:hypothetical protein